MLSNLNVLYANANILVQSWLTSATWRDPSELKCDRCFSVFTRINSLVEEILDLRPDPTRPDVEAENDKGSTWRLIGRGTGVIVALHHVAIKCRDSATRRKALSLLDRLKVQEGLCSSTLLVLFATAIVDKEEERARQMMNIPMDEPLTCKDVPEEARFMEVLMDANTVDLGFGRLLCSTLPMDGIGEFDIDEYRFPSVATPSSTTMSLQTEGSSRKLSGSNSSYAVSEHSEPSLVASDV
jgi:hypothetical protein